jgi:inosine-uridine nucleoside N-ribohydrolase
VVVALIDLHEYPIYKERQSYRLERTPLINHIVPLASLIVIGLLMGSCSPQKKDEAIEASHKIPVIIDTDANNELDDQHAMAYLFFNTEHFDVRGVTVNTTSSGGNIDMQYAEAERVMKLCDVFSEIPLLKGADKSFTEIRPTLDDPTFDGHKAVRFIIENAKESTDTKLVIIAVGKLTNIALAVEMDSTIIDKIRLVWLGSNYPEPGEHNQNNDTVAMNFLLNSELEFEMATVRYGKPSGTDAVKITKQEINSKMPGLGPRITTPIEGRHGGKFNNFGDYSINLFEHIEYHSDPPSRALFDMAAVAIVKDPAWAEHLSIPAPVFIDGEWIERLDNPRHILIWQNFDRTAILADFFSSLGYKN